MDESDCSSINLLLLHNTYEGLLGDAAEMDRELDAEDLDKVDLERQMQRCVHGMSRNAGVRALLQEWASTNNDDRESCEKLLALIDSVDECERAVREKALRLLPAAPGRIVEAALDHPDKISGLFLATSLHLDDMEEEIAVLERRIEAGGKDLTLLELDELLWEYEDIRNEVHADLVQVKGWKVADKSYQIVRAEDVLTEWLGIVDRMLETIAKGRPVAVDFLVRPAMQSAVH